MVNKARKILLSLVIVFIAFSITGCSKKITNDNENFVVVTTLYPTYEFINSILEGQTDTGKKIEVILIVPYGTDSHNFDPSVADSLTIRNCDLFIYTSDEMETWVDDLNLDKDKTLNIYEAMCEKYQDFKELQTLQVDDLKHHDHDHDHGHDHSEESYKDSDNLIDQILLKIMNFLTLIFPHHHSHSYDPHFWTNMKYSEYMVEVIYDALAEKVPDPDGTKKVEMRKNADAYIDDLRCLDRQFMSISENAEDKTLFFGAPFAFYYFTNRYELDYVLTYSTCSTEIDPSILVVLEVVEEMKFHGATVILSKELTSEDAAETIAQHVGGKTMVLHSGHNISPNEVGKTSFLDIMQDNVDVVAEALNVSIYDIDDYRQIKGGVRNAN